MSDADSSRRDHRERRFIRSLPRRARKGFRWVRCGFCGAARQIPDGNLLREKRLAAGLGLREVARRLGLSAAYICDLELNRRMATRRVEDFYAGL